MMIKGYEQRQLIYYSKEIYMNIPKVVRGGFFGIFIPGAFLLINILLVFSIDIPIVSTVREDGKTSTMSAEKDIRTSESILGSIEYGR